MNRRRFRLFSAMLAAFAGVVVFLVATKLFPYHTTNHDEAVYLQQAAMLLEGQLSLYPPVPDSFRPWFFVRDGGRLYPKYAPVPAATFAVGKLLGNARLSLALVGAGSVALTAAIASEAFDRRTGLLAGVFLLASPLFLVDSSVFLPYATTTFWNLLFAFAYVRSARRSRTPDPSARPAGESARGTRGAHGYALLAGLAIGVAFFARPYTAVLFAAPFIAHALYSLWTGPSATRLTRLSLTALGGLAGVTTALAYNAAMTGSPWVFPYAAFAPQDGLGFGHREILGYARDYTPELALRANAEVVSLLFTQWVVGGPVGTLLAAVGVGAFLRRAGFRPADWSAEFTDAQLRAVLAGLFVSVVAGNVFFWGNLNVLGSLANPDDGLVSTLGPYYHFDLLVPTAAFAARGALLGVGRVRALASERTPRSRQVAVGVALAGALVLAGATAGVLAPTISENARITDEYERAYQPFEERDLSDAVVFLPTPYGDWLSHPFQHLRNDPGFDGETVYALSDGPDDFEVAAAYPNRTYYRYVYRGEWMPYGGESVDPALQRVRVVRGERVSVDASLAVPEYARGVSARVSADGGSAYYAVEGTPANLSLDLRVANGTARLAGRGVGPVGENATVPVGREDEVVVQVFVSEGATGFSYRLELPVRRANGSVAALSPAREVCLVARNCNGAAAYVPGSVPERVGMETTLRANGSVDERGNETARTSPDGPRGFDGRHRPTRLR
ncbi:phospholipid carrier-dependent glycosyltransferase [Halorussus caseinilyticus]|uniref:ArnT family glycosyltransferase n=1 Tax=Halorussus caseinilyticus TaxID=3034025 RepID=A0ABD5WIU6_9EURY|nr:phospholipid carrier-dependent glycosyltransferase [Halorussus sp. DT72]